MWYCLTATAGPAAWWWIWRCYRTGTSLPSFRRCAGRTICRLSGGTSSRGTARPLSALSLTGWWNRRRISCGCCISRFPPKNSAKNRPGKSHPRPLFSTPHFTPYRFYNRLQHFTENGCNRCKHWALFTAIYSIFAITYNSTLLTSTNQSHVQWDISRNRTWVSIACPRYQKFLITQVIRNLVLPETQSETVETQGIAAIEFW